MEIIIKKPVKKPKSMYVLNIEYMHGDGDATTYSEFEFEDIEKLKTMIGVMSEAKETHNPKKYLDVIKKHNLDEEEWYQYFDEDSTCQGHMASIQNLIVTYFDDNGLEHEVEVKYDKK